MERREHETDDFYTSSESDSHPLLNEKVDGENPEKRRASLLNGFPSLYINSGLVVLLLISLVANVVSFVYMMIHRYQATPERSPYGWHPSIASLPGRTNQVSSRHLEQSPHPF